MANRIGRHRESGAKSQFNFQLDNDVFNAVNEAAATQGRSISAEVEHRLRRSIEGDPEASPRAMYELANEHAADRLDAMGRMIGQAFVLGVMQARDPRKPLSLAIDDSSTLTDALASAIKHTWAEFGEPVEALRVALINKLPEF